MQGCAPDTGIGQQPPDSPPALNSVHSGRDSVMRLKVTFSGTCRTLKIWACENLDIRLHSAFTNAALVAGYSLVDDIEVDLKNTRIIRDSGLALLMMLRRKSGRQCERIRLVNCPQDLQARLSRDKLGNQFQIV
jgi:hypothetical protein